MKLFKSLPFVASVTSLSSGNRSLRAFPRHKYIIRELAMKSDSAAFFHLKEFAVVGASTEREKFGNKVLRCYQEHGFKVTPINQKSESIEGIECVNSLTDLAALRANTEGKTHADVTAAIGVSIVTPPAVTRNVIEEGYKLGFRNFYLQPGTIDREANEFVKTLEDDVNIIKGCVLVELGFSGF